MRLAASQSRSSSFVSLVLVTAGSVLAACSGASIGDDLTTTPEHNDPPPPVFPKADAGPDAPRPCNGPNLACDPGDDSVGSEANCGNADYCYSRTGCSNVVLWCAHHEGVRCGAVPRCDPGDTEVSACPGGPKGITCYARTVCGSTIECAHSTP